MNEALANPARRRPSIRLERLGSEGEPLVIVDGFSGVAAELERAGRIAEYQPAIGFPGLRSPADRRYLAPLGQMLGDILANAFGFRRANIERCDYSIVSIAPADLSDQQRMPHYDDPGPGVVALLHYLGDAKSGGTAFYRHRRTGYESMRPERVAPYRAALQADEIDYGPNPPAYLHGDTNRFEMIGEIAAKRDRAILYRGRTLHSGVIPSSPDPASARSAGRLTINTFFVGEM